MNSSSCSNRLPPASFWTGGGGCICYGEQRERIKHGTAERAVVGASWSLGWYPPAQKLRLSTVMVWYGHVAAHIPWGAAHGVARKLNPAGDKTSAMYRDLRSTQLRPT